MLFIAAITSSVSMLQPVIAFLEEGLGMKRHASAGILGLITAIGTGYILYFSKGLVALDMFDFWVGTATIPLLALIQAILYGWVFGIERGDKELHVGAHIRVPWFVQLMLKYVVPVYLLVIYVCFCWQKLPSHDVEKAAVPAPVAASFDESSIETAFVAAAIELPQPFVLESNAAVHTWNIRDDAGSLLYSVKPNTDGKLAIFQHVPGYVEAIGQSRTALSSVLFLVTILVFLILLIHIAGRRWQREGRYATTN
jgi:hypothetical protein